MELIIRRRDKGLYMLLSLPGATAASVQTVYGYSAYQLFIVGHSRCLIHTSGGFPFGTEQSTIFSLEFVPENLSRGPPESAQKLFI